MKKVRRGVKPVGMIDAWGFRGEQVPPELVAATARVLVRKAGEAQRAGVPMVRHDFFIAPSPERDTVSFGEDFFRSGATGLGDFGQTPYDLLVGAPPPTTTTTGAAAPAAAPSLWSTIQSLMPAAVSAIQKKLAPSAPKVSKPKAPKPPKPLIGPAPQAGLPGWVTPVAIGAGVLLLGGIAFVMLRKK